MSLDTLHLASTPELDSPDFERGGRQIEDSQGLLLLQILGCDHPSIIQHLANRVANRLERGDEVTVCSWIAVNRYDPEPTHQALKGLFDQVLVLVIGASDKFVHWTRQVRQ